MIRVPRVKLREGMVLAQPVRHPERPSHMLLNTGYTLQATMIFKLEQFDVPEVWIEFPGTEYLEDQVNPEISRLQHETCAALQQGIESLGSGVAFVMDYDALHETIRDLINEIVMSNNALQLMQELNCSDKCMLQHSVNVMLMSVLLGLRLDGYMIQQRSRLSAQNAKKVTSLGVGALLHDIGLTRLDSEVLERWRASGDESDPAWRAHVAEGYAMVKSSIDPTASSVVLHHHQMFDGSGFPEVERTKGDEPRPMSGEQIHVFSRILAVADRFDRLHHPTDGSAIVPRVEVLHRMLFEEAESARFDPTVLRALVDVTPPFEVGKQVRLSDGRDAIVSGVHREEPCRPSVLPLLRNGSGVADAIDLNECRDLRITGVDDVDVQQWIFTSRDLESLAERVAQEDARRAEANEGWGETWVA
jgi:HD-GYP domain-containing protein (c-di-GMP phosphodiesterase class II)